MLPACLRLSIGSKSATHTLSSELPHAGREVTGRVRSRIGSVHSRDGSSTIVLMPSKGETIPVIYLSSVTSGRLWQFLSK
jgi:hypothetical protein